MWRVHTGEGRKNLFARVSTIEGSPERIARGVHSFRERVLPAAKDMHGFEGAYLLVDRKSGKTVSITLWETEQDLQTSTSAANQLRAQAHQESGATIPPKVEVYEVAVEPRGVRPGVV